MADRLAAVLGSAELAWLRARVRERLARGLGLDATVALRSPTLDERAAAARLLGTPIPSGSTLRVALPAVSAVLRSAGLAPDVGAAVVTLDGPVADLAGAAAAEADGWSRLGARLEAACTARPALRPWVADLGRTGLVRRLAGGDLAAGERLVDAALAVVAALPAPDRALARFANHVLGDAHALDPDRPVETLALGAARALVGPPTATGAEGRRETWAAVGVLVDDLTTQVLVLGLPGGTATPVDRLLAAARDAGEPVPLTLGMLVRHPPRLWPAAPAVVSVVENVTVLAAAAAALGSACRPLVCTRGQPTVAVLRLLDAVAATGVRMRYQGDFDWPGVGIANRVLARVPATPWHADAATYRAAAAGGGPPLTSRPVDPTWDAGLGAAMRDLGVKVEQERLVDLLLPDLHG